MKEVQMQKIIKQYNYLVSHEQFKKSTCYDDVIINTQYGFIITEHGIQFHFSNFVNNEDLMIIAKTLEIE